MRALTLYQPWATLVAIGAKKIETRSWSTKYRGPLAIHVSKKGLDHVPIVWNPHTEEILHGIHFPVNQLGCIIAVCRLVECVMIPRNGWVYVAHGEHISINHYPHDHEANVKITQVPPLEPELSFGDYTPGQYAWILENVRMLKEPIPCKGMLGLWNVPEDLTPTLSTNGEGVLRQAP
jgi:activating signal cointegrator 1